MDLFQELEVRPLTEAPDAIARFISEVYDAHPHGKSFVPRWSGPFLKHVVFDHPEFTPDHALGAYAGDTLVGLILAQPHRVHVGQATHPAIYGSWLAVRPGPAAPMAAIALIDELRSRHGGRGAKCMVGAAYRSGKGAGLDFWEGLSRAFPGDVSTMRDVTFWARVLDGEAFARAVKDPLLKVAAQAARLRPIARSPLRPPIRLLEPRDLEACQRMMKSAPATMRTALDAWELTPAPSLATGPQTLVADDGNGADAFALFHMLPMEDAGPLKVGMIEHVVDATSSRRHEMALIAAALWRLKEADASLGLVLRKPHQSSTSMMMAGFVPYSAEFRIFLLPYGDEPRLDLPESFDLLLR